MKGAHLADLSAPSDKLSEEKKRTCAARPVAILSENPQLQHIGRVHSHDTCFTFQEMRAF